MPTQKKDPLANSKKEGYIGFYATDTHSATNTPGTFADRAARKRPDKRLGYLLFVAAAPEAA